MPSLDTEWIEELKAQAKGDIEFWPISQDQARLKPALYETLDALAPEQREVVLAYLRTCRRAEVALTRIAYQLGQQHGQKTRTP